MFTSADDLVEEMPVVDALGAFLAYLDLSDRHALDAKLHRSGRHPDDLQWSSHSRYHKKLSVAGRVASSDDSSLFTKLNAEQAMKAKALKARQKRVDAAVAVEVPGTSNYAGGDGEDFPSTPSANATDDKLRAVFRAYGKWRRFNRAPPRGSFKGAQASYPRADRPDRGDTKGDGFGVTGTGTAPAVQSKNSPKEDSDDDQPSGVWELESFGWQKLVRDCGLLDNSTTSVCLDDLFTNVDAGRVGFDTRNRDERRRRAATAAAHGDAKIEFGEFKVLLRELAKRRYRVLKAVAEGGRKTAISQTSQEANKAEHAGKVDAAYAALVRYDILPNANVKVEEYTKTVGALGKPTLVTKKQTKTKRETDLESLYSQPALQLFRKHDQSLRRVYAHYATLETFSATTKKVEWRAVETTGATMNRDEFVCFLTNFDVVPHLLSRDSALLLFREVEAANDGDGLVDEIAFPAFLETLGRLGTAAFQNAVPVLRNKRADVFAVRSFKKLVAAAPKDLWELGTLGALFRERGFFTGVDGGFDLTKSHRAGRAVAIAAVRKGRVSVLHDPTAYAHDLYTHAHSNQWTREDAKQRSIEHAYEKKEERNLKRNPGSIVPEKLPSVHGKTADSHKPKSKTFTPTGWVPGGVSESYVRSPGGSGGMNATYDGYQQSPGVKNLEWRVNEKIVGAPTPRMRVRVLNELGVSQDCLLTARYARDASFEGAVMGGPNKDSEEKMFSTLRAARERYGMTALSPTKDSAGTADDFGTDTNSAFDDDLNTAEFSRRRADRVWEDAARARVGETTGRPWVHGSVPSFDPTVLAAARGKYTTTGDKQFNLSKSFHAGNDGTMTHKPRRDVYSEPNAKALPTPKKSVAFDPPVERPGYDAAVGGLLTRRPKRGDDDDDTARRDEYEPPSDDESKEYLDEVEEAMATTEFESKQHYHSSNQHWTRIPVIRSPGSKRTPSLNHTSVAVQTSPGGKSIDRNSPVQDAVRIASPGTYAYGIGTSFARPGEVLDGGVAFSRRAALDFHSFPKRDGGSQMSPGYSAQTTTNSNGNPNGPPRRRRDLDFSSLPHPAVAEVSNLGWFEDVRSKALRQRGLPSTKFLDTWQTKLGTKQQRLKDEDDVAAVQRGLRARLLVSSRG